MVYLAELLVVMTDRLKIVRIRARNMPCTLTQALTDDNAFLQCFQSESAIPNMTFSSRNVDPLTRLAPKFPNSATQILLFRLKLFACILATVETSNFKFGTQINFGTSLPKNDV